MAEVVLHDVSKVFPGGVVAVGRMSLAVADGELVVLVGPSGCGKSTTLRMIAGLEEVTTGTISIGDRMVNDIEPKNRNVAMVFQSYALYPHMSVRDNLAFGLKMRRMPRPQIQQKVQSVAEVLGIGELLDRKPRALSGGQRQRVALGRAIVRDPDVFLFDEPLSNLDAKMRVQMRTEISRLHHRLGATMIYVTHDQTEAMTLGQRIVIMHEGLIQQIDTPLALYERPANAFVGGFIGSPAMNFLPGKLVRTDGLFLLPDGAQLSEAVRLPAGFAPPPHLREERVLLGIRPEHVRVSGVGAGDGTPATAPRPQSGQAGHEPRAAAGPMGTASIRAAVQVIEPLGNETLLYFSVAGQPFTARVPGQITAAVDQQLDLAVSVEHIHLFAPSDGRNLLLASS